MSVTAVTAVTACYQPDPPPEESDCQGAAVPSRLFPHFTKLGDENEPRGRHQVSFNTANLAMVRRIEYPF
jgi:hypothetical protein